MTSVIPMASELNGARVIVTGASGFIGLNMVRKLSSLGAEVVIIDRIQLSEPIPGVEMEWVDLRHIQKTYEADYLIHLAAITNAGYAEKYPMDTYEVNVIGTLNLLNHVKINKRIFFPSTALTYAASKDPISENAEKDLSSTYAQSKDIGEQIVRTLSKRMGVDWTLVRFFNVFGPGQLAMYIVPQVLRQIMLEGKIVLRNGSVMRDLLYVDDCIDAVLKLVVSPDAVESVFNIGSGEIVSIYDVAKAAARVSGRDDVEIVDLEENIEYSPTAIIADITKITSTIDWYPKVDLEAGLRKMWEYNTGK
jgi:nucleoside-diphosphate-sugar epimerase